MELSNKHIYGAAVPVTDDEFDKWVEVGREMRKFAKSNNYVCLCANQIGCDKSVCVIHDNKRSNDGYTTYFNSEILAPPDMGIVCRDVDLVSFPRKFVKMDVSDGALVSAYSVDDEDRIELDLGPGELSFVWWVTSNCLNGINPDNVVDRDYRTVRGTQRIKPNAKCIKCGRKNKLCICKGC